MGVRSVALPGQGEATLRARVPFFIQPPQAGKYPCAMAVENSLLYGYSRRVKTHTLWHSRSPYRPPAPKYGKDPTLEALQAGNRAK